MKKKQFVFDFLPQENLGEANGCGVECGARHDGRSGDAARSRAPENVPAARGRPGTGMAPLGPCDPQERAGAERKKDPQEITE